jgi:hypothetical protein
MLNLFKKKHKENLIFTINILTKKKYNHLWQREYIGDLLSQFADKYFDRNAIFYYKEGDLFDSFEIILEGSKFKINENEDINDSKQFIVRYAEFLSPFLEVIDKVLQGLNLKYKIHRIQHLGCSLDDYLKSIAMNKVEEVTKKKTKKVEPMNIHFIDKKK